MTTNWNVGLDLDAAVSRWGQRIAPSVEDHLKATIPVKTGAAQASIEAQATPEGVDATGSKIAGYLETGTSAHPIDSKGPWSLHNAETGEYFGSHVEHPGTDPSDFVENAENAGGEEWTNDLWQEIANEWSSP